MKSIQITRPDDWHVHFRDGKLLENTVPATANHFGRALVMPNLTPPLIRLHDILEYHRRILNASPKKDFIPFMTFFLHENMNPAEFEQAKRYPFIVGAKLYPAGVTTNSDQGIQSFKSIYPLLATMEENNLVLQVHGEVTHSDIFDRERLFLEEVLRIIVEDFPKLRVVLEHISTKSAVDYVKDAPQTVSATITPHHLLYNRNHLLAGGVKPHYYCLPILKKKSDQIALQEAATSGNPKFFAGTDSAPHAQNKKEASCGCAGIYSAPFAISMYAEIFAALNKLPQLNHFLGHFGAQFYGFAPNSSRIELIEKPFIIPDALPLGNEVVIPAGAQTTLHWSINEA
ncbi:dihydroorotase [Legionella adelaidensis]|nr:dihydroorotase [Legionella adelaidensis]